MKDLFGLPTSDLAVALAILLGVSVASVAWIALRSRTMFRMGVRNLPRRGSQTVLVVAGLMLATLITTAAFVTGDTIDHTLTNGSHQLFQRSDLDISWNGQRDFDRDAGAATAAEQVYANAAVAGVFESRFAGDPDIETFLPFLVQQAPVTDARSGRAVPAATLSGFDPERLARAGGLRLAVGGTADLAQLAPGDVYLSKRAAKALDARAGDTVAIYVNRQPHEFGVAAIVEDELASGVLGLPFSTVPGGVALRLDSLQQLVGQPGKITSLTVALRGGVRGAVANATPARDRLRQYLQNDGARVFAQAGGLEPNHPVRVDAAKQVSVENGELAGNAFTTIFLVLGLFSMAAGTMLIFMIFVMLAAERRAEMGMARAVGAQRGHLVRAFIAEGMAYSLLAGVLGAGAGVLASLGLTLGLLKFVGGDYFSIVEFSMSPKSLVIGYSLGVVITFVTVVFASLKVTHVNIVAAIRNLDEDTKRAPRRRTRWAWVAAGVPALVVPPLGLWFILRRGFGLPKSMIFAPAGIVLGLLFMLLGKSGELLFPFALGISLLPICGGAVARRLGAPNRGAWTTVGLLLLAYWLMPANLHEALFGSFDSDIEMFIISGVMIVIGFTLVLVFNARVLTAMFNRSAEGAAAYLVAALLLLVTVAFMAVAITVGGRANGLGEVLYIPAGLALMAAALSAASARFPQLAPALKMAVAYPLSNRFRTGMTIAMFGLIVFSLTVFSILNANFNQVNSNAEARGGLDIIATIAPRSAVTDVRTAATQAGVSEAAAITGEGAVTLGTGTTLVRQLDRAQAWTAYPVLAANDAFFTGLGLRLEARATLFASDAAAIAAVRGDRTLALVDPFVIGEGNNESPFVAAGVKVSNHTFEPFDIEAVNPETGKLTTFTVVGALKSKLAPAIIGGVYVNADAYRGAGFGQPVFQRHFLRLAPGADAGRTAIAIQSALGTQGVGADAIKALLDKDVETSNVFVRMMQAFMALGLFVGIAGLGVIAFRSVVERRQQIGMLRAIGYQRGTVSLTFMLESSFIAAMGILTGVVGGAVLGRNLMTSDSFPGTAGLEFSIPWTELLAVMVASFAAALVMTWLPSRGAARVPVADALRYE